MQKRHNARARTIALDDAFIRNTRTRSSPRSPASSHVIGRLVSHDPFSRSDRATLLLRSQSGQQRFESDADALKEPTESSSSAQILPTEGAATFHNARKGPTEYGIKLSRAVT